MSAIEPLAPHYRDVFIEILQVQDPALLAALKASDAPTIEEREAVENIFVREFTRHLLPNSEPTQRGIDIDNALGAFLLEWPIQRG